MLEPEAQRAVPGKWLDVEWLVRWAQEKLGEVRVPLAQEGLEQQGQASVPVEPEQQGHQKQQQEQQQELEQPEQGPWGQQE